MGLQTDPRNARSHHKPTVPKMYTVLCQDVDQPDRWFLATGLRNAIWPEDDVEELKRFAELCNKNYAGVRIHKVVLITEVF